jgi:hypothetical protein
MSELPNPYNSREPVSSEEMFFGRRHELHAIADFLKAGQSVSIVGPLKIGKTSLILHLMRLQAAPRTKIGSNTLLAYLDCRSLCNLDPSGILQQFSSELLIQWKTLGLPEEEALSAACAAPSYAAFEAAIRAIHRQGYRAILILDAFEALSADARIDTRFYNALRSIAGIYRLAFLTVSAAPLIQLTFSGPAQDYLSSPFFNIFATVNLGLMPASEAGALIRRPAERAGLPFLPQVQQFLHRLSGGHPYIIQTACSLAFRLPSDMAGIERKTAMELRPYFESVWHNLSPAERRALLEAPAQPWAGTKTGEQSTLSDLLRKCLLVHLRGRYVHSCKAWTDFLSGKYR